MNHVRNKNLNNSADSQSANRISYGMKVLIGTPIHQVKDYAMERWLTNLAQLTKETPADLLLVDNSPGTDYAKKVKGYCAKYGISRYKFKHFDFQQGMSVDEKDARIWQAEEIIRQYMLSHDYDAWFSWECDQIIPNNTLDELVKMMQAGSYMMVVHNTWERLNPAVYNPDMGCTLISRDCLKKNSFLPKDGSGHWRGAEAWFKERVLRAGGNYIDVYGLVNPIYHLNQPSR